MAQKGRWVLDWEKEEIWRLWRSGTPLRAIGRGLNRRSAVVRKVVEARGGFAPTPRRRAPRTLSRSEREEVSRGIAAGLSMRTMAAALKRAPSTISREIARHGGREAYRAEAADRAAWANARRPKPCWLATTPRLRNLVSRKLRLEWS